MKKVTITDIAREAGVSKATVSRVLNSSGPVNPRTRQHVLAIIAQRNYSPSAAARSLSKSSTTAIGVIVPEVDNPFYGEVLRGITEIIDRNNLILICCNTDDDPGKDRKALEMLKEHRVRGLIYAPAVDYSGVNEKKQLQKLVSDLDLPMVMIDRKVDYLKVDGVYFNDYQGMYDAAKALIDAGHKKIGIINGTMDRVLARDRQRGYQQAMKDAGLVPEERFTFLGDFRLSRSYELAKKLLEAEELPTAVLTCNNSISMGFLKALHEKGMSIPKDMACVGLDNMDVLELVGMKFNYIHRDARKLGEKAMELLISRMSFPDTPPVEIILDAPVVIKQL